MKDETVQHILNKMYYPYKDLLIVSYIDKTPQNGHRHIEICFIYNDMYFKAYFVSTNCEINRTDFDFNCTVDLNGASPANFYRYVDVEHNFFEHIHCYVHAKDFDINS